MFFGVMFVFVTFAVTKIRDFIGKRKRFCVKMGDFYDLMIQSILAL
jgi:hypothetical protein